VKSHSEIATLKGHSDSVNSIAFSPDGSLLASGSDDTTIKLWDVKSHSEIATLKGHSNSVNSIAFSPDGNLLASGSDDKTIKLWDVRSRTLFGTLQHSTGSVYSIIFSPDGSLIASGSGDKTVKLWDVRSKTLLETFQHSDDVTSFAFSPDSTLLAIGGRDGIIKLWGVKNLEEIVALKGNPNNVTDMLRGYSGEVNSVAFSPDGNLLASGYWGRTILLWDMKPYIQKPVEDVDKLKSTINAKLSQRPIYPPYLLDTDSFMSAVNTIWQNVTDWFRRNDLTDNYEELYYTGIEYDNMRFGALIKARDFLDKGDVANAKRFLDKADTYEKMSNISFQGANYVFEANLEVAKTLAQSIKDGCQASVKFGLQFVNPTAAEVADYIYDLTDLGIEYYIGDKDQAVKDFILKRSVDMILNEVVFNELDGKTLSDWTENRTGKYLFPLLSKFIKSEEWQWALSKVIKEGVSSISEETLSEIIKFTVNVSDKMMNYVVVKLKSPAELRILDSQGRITGLVNGKVKNEIPGSVYDNETITVFFPTEVYHYEVAGKDKGTYGLEVTLTKDANTTVFNANAIPTSANAVHEYSVDWDTLSKDKGVTINIDSNGDGKIDETINSGASFTEYNCDVNSDGVVNILDLVIVAKFFGKYVNNAKADVNKDGIVDVLDLNIVGQHFGEVYK